MKHKPVSADAYDETWLKQAWGSKANEALLREIDHPRPRVARALELAALEPGQTLLDIACGRGEVPALAAQCGAIAIGIDFSHTSLAYAAKVKATQKKIIPPGRMELVQADACSLPFADASFDRITMLDIVEHLIPEQLDAMLLEVRRLLKPDGYAVIHTLPNRWVYDITFPILHKLMPRIPSDPRGPIDRNIHVNEQDVPGLHCSLAKSGLNHRIWLEQHIPAQARWNRMEDHYGDNRDSFYPILTGLLGRLLEIIAFTPAKLFLCNDIFALAWAGSLPPKTKHKRGLTEKLAIHFFPCRQPQACRHPSQH